ncbi:Serine/threonine protein phosphatase 7 long form isogeny [Sesbania bispinosa]|nr:Serine/threonine protein phosphatase 7 long form isogeny [Sesbania bispinosa]
MTIILDDVSSLLHLPITGRLFFLPALGKDDANQLLISALKVSHVDAFTKIEVTVGAYDGRDLEATFCQRQQAC